MRIVTVLSTCSYSCLPRGQEQWALDFSRGDSSFAKGVSEVPRAFDIGYRKRDASEKRRYSSKSESARTLASRCEGERRQFIKFHGL